MLSTLNADRGIDSVPVCFAVSTRAVLVPVDTVKPKSSTHLQRATNLATEPGATLLCEHWDMEDWTTLWWVSTTLLRIPAGDLTDPLLGDLSERLRSKYRQYRSTEFADLLAFRVVDLAGWSAAG